MMGAGGLVRADEDSAYCRAIYPEAHELFAPLLADPRELQFGPRYEMPVSQVPQAEADIGDYMGLYRWCLGPQGERGRLQITAGVVSSGSLIITTPRTWRLLMSSPIWRSTIDAAGGAAVSCPTTLVRIWATM